MPRTLCVSRASALRAWARPVSWSTATTRPSLQPLPGTTVRDQVEVGELNNEIGADEFGVRAGKPLRGQFSLTKHRWLRRHNPAVASAVRRFNVAEWVARGLGSDEACDRSLACRTGWFDPSAGGGWPEALAWSGASVELMPPLVDSGVAIGRVKGARGHPRLADAVVTLAGHDHQAAALGVGAVLPGDELDSSGTAEALVRTVLPDLGPEQMLALARAESTAIQPEAWSFRRYRGRARDATGA